jgi:hypothetical protein
MLGKMPSGSMASYAPTILASSRPGASLALFPIIRTDAATHYSPIAFPIEGLGTRSVIFFDEESVRTTLGTNCDRRFWHLDFSVTQHPDFLSKRTSVDGLLIDFEPL